MKKCPYCAEEIQAEAVYCRFCQKELPAGEPATKVIKPSQKSGWFGRAVAGLVIVIIIAVLTLATQTDMNSLFPAWLQKKYLWPSVLYGVGSEMESERDGAVLVYVPEGEFLMGFDESGDDAEKPARKVRLDAFWIDKTEVTNAMFARFLNDSGHHMQAWRQAEGFTWMSPRGAGSSAADLDDHPVVQVAWEDAAAYCRWAGRRLPTEAEWEKAATGWPQNVAYMLPRNFTYSWGYDRPDGSRLNFADVNSENKEAADQNVNDGYKYTAPVGSYPEGASPYGALDMTGNALEWAADWFDLDYYHYAPASNPTGPWTGDGHVLKGGSFESNEWDVRTFHRYRFDPGMAGMIGFRCAQDFDENNSGCVACNLRDAWEEFMVKLKCIWDRAREQ